MKRYPCIRRGILSLGMLLVTGIPTFAMDSRIVTLSHEILLNGRTLPAGTYGVEWKNHRPGAVVQFVQRFRVVLFTEGRVERRGKAYTRNAIVYNLQPDGSSSLIEIRFAKSKKVLVFNHENDTPPPLPQPDVEASEADLASRISQSTRQEHGEDAHQ